MSKDAGATWAQTHAFGSAESILDIDCLSDRAIVITGQYADTPQALKPLKNVKLYSSKQIDLNEPTAIYNYDVPASLQSSILQIRGEQTQDKYLFNVPVSLMSLDLKKSGNKYFSG
jgi:hypothetical protein